MNTPTHTSNRILLEALVKRHKTACFCNNCAILRGSLVSQLVPKVIIDEAFCPLAADRINGERK